MKVHRLPRLGQPSPAQTRDDEVVKIAALSWLPAWAGLGWAGLAGLGGGYLDISIMLLTLPGGGGGGGQVSTTIITPLFPPISQIYDSQIKMSGPSYFCPGP